MTQGADPFAELKRLLESGQMSKQTYDATVAALSASNTGSGSIAQGEGATAAGANAVVVGGDASGGIDTSTTLTAAEGAQIVYAEQGATVIIGDAPVTMTKVARETALGRYLQHLISQNRYLQLQGIRSGGRLVNIELDRIYVTLRATRQLAHRADPQWLAQERVLAPGERHRSEVDAADTSHVTVNEALAVHRRLVVLGDPGSGKTTLLRYLALVHARDLAEGASTVREKLGLNEREALPIFLALRQLGRYLAEHQPRDDGTEGHAVLMQFLLQGLKNERIEIPHDFFDAWLTTGRAAVLLDGLDEVADHDLRRRVSRLVDAFTRAYPKCRYVITSRIVGYTDAVQLTEGYATSTVRDFTIEDIGVFLSQWHRLVAIGQMGPGPTAEAHAANQTRELLDAVTRNDRVRELAINPLMLTVIALVHRDRVRLPDRRAELYYEAVEVLLGKWDEARGVPETLSFNNRPFDANDRRLVLQHVALAMHEQAIKEIDAGPLRALLAEQLRDVVPEPRALDAAVEKFLEVIQERTGLLIARAEGTFAFSHLTFQEYLAALCIAGRDDYVEYTLRRSADAWWREVILLEAGYLSTQGKEKTTRLIRAIAEAKIEPAPYHNLVLAAECVRDAGANRLAGDLDGELKARLRSELDQPFSGRGVVGSMKALLTRGMSAAALIKRRIAAAEALGNIGGHQYWTLPYGEPEWVAIPAGEFTMGEGSEAHRVHLPAYAIAKAPVTNAQYELFVQATQHESPRHWNGQRAPRGRESHPAIYVNWLDALAYCNWLSDVTGKAVALPSEAEWEKAARGAADPRAYPWGDSFDSARCNTSESGFGDTTPVGIFANGASPYGCLDMAGNVWEWTRSLIEPYPFRDADALENHVGANSLVVRGGSWNLNRNFARCAVRSRYHPDFRRYYLGFRVVLRAAPVP